MLLDYANKIPRASLLGKNHNMTGNLYEERKQIGNTPGNHPNNVSNIMAIF